MSTDMIEGLMGKLAASGWSGIDINQADVARAFKTQNAATDAELDRQAAIVARALETEDGRALLDLLLRITVLRPPDEEERAARSADAYAILAAQRRGQNSLMFWLLSRLQRHHGKPTGGTEQL